MSGYLVVPRERDKREVMELCRVGRDRNLGVRRTHRTWGVRIPATDRGSEELSPEHFDQNGDCLLSYLHEAFLPPGNEDPQGRTLKEI